MEQKKFMKEISALGMPDIKQIKRECIEELHKEKKRKTYLFYIGGAAAAVIVLFLCVSPVPSFAKNIWANITAVLKLNHAPVDLGTVAETAITIPKDCEEVEYEGIMYLTKGYQSISDLKKETGADFYTLSPWETKKDGVMLNIVDDDYARITLLYDVTGGKLLQKKKGHEGMQFMELFVYIPLKEKADLKELMLQDEQMKYSTVDDAGNITKYEQNTEYELIEQYESRALGTTVSVIASKSRTKIDNEDGKEREDKISDEDMIYYIYFTLDDMCYQMNYGGDLEMAHGVIEDMKK